MPAVRLALGEGGGAVVELPAGRMGEAGTSYTNAEGDTMNRWLRRIRAAVVTGLTWGLAWFGAGMVLLLIVGLGAADVPFPLGFGLLGFFAGTVFSGVLGVTERGRRIDQLSLPRFALWGAVGGLVLSGIFAAVAALAGAGSMDLLVIGPVFALAGAGSAAGSLALARSGTDRESIGPATDSKRLR